MLQNEQVNSGQPAESALAQEISFKEIVLGTAGWFKYLLSQWKIILVIALIAGAFNLWRISKRPLLYVASSTFVLKEAGAPNMNNQSGIASFFGFNNGGAGGGTIFQGDNLLELYRSRLMIKRALLSKVPDSTDYFIDRYIKINGLREYWKAESPELNKINFFNKGNRKYTRTQDSLMTTFVDDIRANYLAVAQVGRLSLFKVEVKSVNEDFSMMFNEQIVKTVNDYYIQTSTQKAAENVQLLQHQVDSIRGALNGAMYRAASATDVTINANPARQVLRIPSQRNQVDAENNRIMLNELVRNLEMAKMGLQKEAPLIQIIDGPFYPLETRYDSRLKAFAIGAVGAGFLVALVLSVMLLYRKIIA